MIRIALIGCGAHARLEHAAPLAKLRQQLGSIELVAACDTIASRAQQFCDEFGFRRCYTRFEQMLESEELDGCYCVAPPAALYEVAAPVLKRGVACVIEKPPGKTWQEAQALTRLAEQTGTRHMVSMNRRFNPFIHRAIAWCRSRGPIAYARCTMVRHARTERQFIWSTAIHGIDTLRHLAGDIDGFDVRVMKQPGLSTTWYDVALQFGRGALGSMQVLPTAGHADESYDLCGEGFQTTVALHNGRCVSWRCWSDNRLVLESLSCEKEPDDVRCGAHDENLAFLKALKEQRPMSPTLGDVLPSALLGFEIAERAGADLPVVTTPVSKLALRKAPVRQSKVVGAVSSTRNAEM